MRMNGKTKSYSLGETWLSGHRFSILFLFNTLYKCKKQTNTLNLWTSYTHMHTERETEKGRGLERHIHLGGYHKLSKALCLIGWACNLSRMSRDLVAKATTRDLPAQPYFLWEIVILMPNVRSNLMILIICISLLHSTAKWHRLCLAVIKIVL